MSDRAVDPTYAPPAQWSVLSIAATSTGLWAATDAGLRRWADRCWDVPQTPPGLDFVAIVAAINTSADTHGHLLAAGLPAGITYSFNGGREWYQAVVDPIESSVSCLAASPRFAQDRVLLAGTEQDGILRSTDGGRRWRLANFGLTEFTILALTAAPSWDRREDLFAATDGGLYRSPNGGRAWKRADIGIEGLIVQTLTCSPNYALDQCVVAGCEDAPIHQSHDAGRSWHVLDAAPQHANSIWIHPTKPNIWLAGTSEGLLGRTQDAGLSWQVVYSGNDAILTLAASGSVVYAGRYGGGLLCSQDEGLSWGIVA